MAVSSQGGSRCGLSGSVGGKVRMALQSAHPTSLRHVTELRPFPPPEGVIR